MTHCTDCPYCGSEYRVIRDENGKHEDRMLFCCHRTIPVDSAQIALESINPVSPEWCPLDKGIE